MSFETFTPRSSGLTIGGWGTLEGSDLYWESEKGDWCLPIEGEWVSIGEAREIDDADPYRPDLIDRVERTFKVEKKFCKECGAELPTPSHDIASPNQGWITDLVYPQYRKSYEGKTISTETWEYMQQYASNSLHGRGINPSEEIKEHWLKLVQGIVPWDLRIVAVPG